MACGDTTTAVMYGKPSIIVKRYWAFWGLNTKITVMQSASCRLNSRESISEKLYCRTISPAMRGLRLNY